MFGSRVEVVQHTTEMVGVLVPNDDLGSFFVGDEGLIASWSSLKQSQSPLIQFLPVLGICAASTWGCSEAIWVPRHGHLPIWLLLLLCLVLVLVMLCLSRYLRMLSCHQLVLAVPICTLDCSVVVWHVSQAHEAASAHRLVVDGVVRHDVEIVVQVVGEWRRNIEDVRSVIYVYITLMNLQLCSIQVDISCYILIAVDVAVVANLDLTSRRRTLSAQQLLLVILCGVQSSYLLILFLLSYRLPTILDWHRVIDGVGLFLIILTAIVVDSL